MAKNVFGSQDSRGGAKVVSQQEWNNLNNSLTNIDVGGRYFEYADASASGIDMPAEAFFHQHVAYIGESYTDGVIGLLRGEEYYPYTDALGVQASKLIVTYKLDTGLFYPSSVISKSNFTSVLFPTATTTAITTPATPANPVVLGYLWNLVPTVEGVTMSADSMTMEVTWGWTPGADFDADAQSSIVCVDVENGNTEDWAVHAEEGADFATTKEALINVWIAANEPTWSLITLGDSTAKYPYLDIFAPVASYEWSPDQSELTRVVQILFNNTIGGSGVSGDSILDDSLDHPFKSRIKPDYTNIVEVGYLRPTWKDSIIIEDPASDHDIAIDFGAAEEITLDSIATFKNYYIYYDIYFDQTSNAWIAVLEKDIVWPPTQDTAGTDATMTGNIIRQIGYAAYDSGNATYVWYQHMYECPTEMPVVPRGEFEAWYVDDGFVRIADGKVNTFNNDTATVGGASFDLSVDIFIWVEITSTPSAGNPSVVVTAGLQSGPEPAMQVAGVFNYVIGYISNFEYVPCHKGRLHIDNTLLMPLISAAFSSATNSPRLMAFNDSQATTVGLLANDTLIDAEFLEAQVIGGGVEHLIEGTAVKMYGKTDSDTSLQLVATSGVNGATFGTGSISLLPQNLTWSSDTGLVQAMDYSPGTVARIAAGTNVQIAYAAGVATISADATGSIATKNSIELDLGSLQLVGDEANPPAAWKFYGTEGTPASGFQQAQTITVITGVQLDASNNLQIKTRQIRAFDLQTESSWTTVTGWTTTACP